MTPITPERPPTKAQIARLARYERIIDAARDIAEADGWAAVTVRRLADAIGYSQPVLYGHFPDGRDGIVRAVAMDGFTRLADTLTASEPSPAAVVDGYLAFAAAHPATYDAMFSMPTDIVFASDDTPEALRVSFARLSAVVAGTGDPETNAELLWIALHGLVELQRHGRLRPAYAQERRDRLVAMFTNHGDHR